MAITLRLPGTDIGSDYRTLGRRCGGVGYLPEIWMLPNVVDEGFGQ